MITLWLTQSALRRGHDPARPKLTDITATNKLGELAHQVVAHTSLGIFLLKDPDYVDVTNDAAVALDTILPRLGSIVVFDGVLLDGGSQDWSHDSDEYVYRAMETALASALPVEKPTKTVGDGAILRKHLCSCERVKSKVRNRSEYGSSDSFLEEKPR